MILFEQQKFGRSMTTYGCVRIMSHNGRFERFHRLLEVASLHFLGHGWVFIIQVYHLYSTDSVLDFQVCALSPLLVAQTK